MPTSTAISSCSPQSSRPPSRVSPTGPPPSSSWPTSATTFLAHVVAHNIGQAIGQAIGRAGDELRLHLAQEARDAVPVMSSGTGPIVLLALGAVGWLPPGLSQVLAEAAIVLRLAATGIIVRRISGHVPALAGVWFGFALAGIGVVIAALKYILAH